MTGTGSFPTRPGPGSGSGSGSGSIRRRPVPIAPDRDRELTDAPGSRPFSGSRRARCRAAHSACARN